MYDLDLLIAQAEIESGLSAALVSSRLGDSVPVSAFGAVPAAKAAKAPRWTEAEEQFLRDNLGKLTDQEMADALGRTANGVHLHWERDMGLRAPSRNPDNLTAHHAADVLGIEVHATAYWVDMGLLPGYRMAGGRQIRIIDRKKFTAWVVNPKHWVYFDWRKITDPHLRRLCELKAARWGDEWLTTSQAARLRGVDSVDFARLCKAGKVPGAIHIPFSRGGRNKGDRRWRYWYILRSDAERLVIRKGKGSSSLRFTPRAIDWMQRATAAGWSQSAIARSMGGRYSKAAVAAYILNNIKRKAPG